MEVEKTPIIDGKGLESRYSRWNQFLKDFIGSRSAFFRLMAAVVVLLWNSPFAVAQSAKPEPVRFKFPLRILRKLPSRFC